MNDKKVILEGHSIKKSYKEDQVLEIDSVKIYEGVFNFLLGPNGSGKTTLLNILSQVDVDYQGQVFYRGQKVVKQELNVLKLRRRFSVIWQNPYLYKGSAASNIGLPLHLRNENNGNVQQKVEKLAADLNISHLLKKKSSELSGGEQQKVSIARALITEPEVLFIDEPHTSLDYESSRFFNNLFTDLVNEGITILLITHDLYQIENMADYIILLKEGKVVESNQAQKVSL